MSDQIGVFRRCVRCWRWLSIDAFVDIGKLCRACTSTNVKVPVTTIARARSIVITPKGRQALREVQPAA